MRSVDQRMIWNADDTSSCNWRPIGVSVTERTLRSNSLALKKPSSTPIWRLTAACVTPSSSAASVNDLQRAATSKVRSGLSGGKRLLMKQTLAKAQAYHHNAAAGNDAGAKLPPPGSASTRASHASILPFWRVAPARRLNFSRSSPGVNGLEGSPFRVTATSA